MSGTPSFLSVSLELALAPCA